MMMKVDTCLKLTYYLDPQVYSLEKVYGAFDLLVLNNRGEAYFVILCLEWVLIQEGAKSMGCLVKTLLMIFL